MSAQSPSDQEVEAVHRYAATLMRDGMSAAKVEHALMAKGLDDASAAAVVANLARMRSQARREEGQKNMIHGALWCVGGLVVTIGTYAAATGGGVYIVTWGAIAYGAIRFFRGLSQSER